jgi:hypothetical protein
MQVVFGSDRASVMRGEQTGVSTRIAELIPNMIAIHCVAHCLALGSKTFSDSYLYAILGMAQNLLGQIYNFLSQSPKRQQYMKVLELANAKLKVLKPHTIRWLSVSGA